MSERISLVHRDMFSPRPEGVEHFDALVHVLVGEPAAEITAGIREGRFTRFNVPPDLRERANTHFYNAMADKVDLPRGINPAGFWEARIEDAIGVHQTVRTTFPSLGIDVLTEVATPDPDIADTIAVLAAKGHATLPGHERKGRMLMGLVAAAITADDMRVNMRGELVRVERTLLEHFFLREDETRLYKLHTYHDGVTHSYEEPRFSIKKGLLVRKGAVERSFTVSVRDARGADKPVHFFSGLKPRESAIIKALYRASGNEGDVIPEKDVRDRYRVAIAGMGKIDANAMARTIREILHNNYRPIQGFDPKHSTDGYNNFKKGNRLGWHREKVSFEGMPTPLELALFDLRSFVNYNVEIGKKNPETGIYGGIARELYEPFRMQELLAILYTREEGLYRVNPQRAVADRMEELVPGIRSKGEGCERPFD